MRRPRVHDAQSPFTEAFDDFVDDLLQKWHVPAMSIAIVDGTVTYSKV